MISINVSIIIPIYNAEKYLHQCLDSVINQTLKDVEIICIDDGSTDHSLEILQYYSKMDRRIIVYHQDNKYAGTARNIGIQHATGEYLLFLDADDFFSEKLADNAYKKGKSTNADIVIFDAWYFNELTGKKEERNWLIKRNYLPQQDIFNYHDIPEHILNISTPVPWNKIFRREFVLENYLWFQEIKRSNDEYFSSIAMVCAKRITYLDDKLVFYRFNNSNSLQGTNSGHFLEFYIALLTTKDRLKKDSKWEQVEKSYMNKALSTCISILRKQKNGEDFEWIYNQLKNTIFYDLGLMSKTYYFDANGDEFEKICKYTALEYLLEENRQLNREIDKIKTEGFQPKHLFPFNEIERNCRIVIYAAGNVGKEYYRQLIYTQYCEKIYIIDKNAEQFKNSEYQVDTIEKLYNIKFDYIVIAIYKKEIAEKVKDDLINFGIEKDKIIWSQP